METQSFIRGDATLPTCEKTALPDLLIFSHVRWNAVADSQEHLIRWAHERRIFFIEEPLFRSPTAESGSLPLGSEPEVQLLLRSRGPRLVVVTPRLFSGSPQSDCVTAERRLLDSLMKSYRIHDYLLWYHTPMALGVTRHLKPRGVIYDCMDDLLGSDGAPHKLRLHELELFAQADVVLPCWAGAEKQPADRALTLLPSVESGHFPRTCRWTAEPIDQGRIARPRLGCFGVIDERIDLELVEGLGKSRPDWQLVLVGPLGKVELAQLPRRPNIHYLGMKTYEELPEYLAGWDVAIMPFAHNEATAGMSPMKTPEYLASGRQVVSTAIPDVVSPFGEKGLVRIADTLPQFVQAVEAALDEGGSATCARITVPRPTWDAAWQPKKAERSGAVAARR
jgi:glycosyltransferase involved in cell wall biosynthesis